MAEDWSIHQSWILLYSWYSCVVLLAFVLDVGGKVKAHSFFSLLACKRYIDFGQELDDINGERGKIFNIYDLLYSSLHTHRFF